MDSCDSIYDPHHPVTDEFLKSLLPHGFPQSVMKLKIGVPIMLLRNINASKGLCNGTRLIVTRLHRNCIRTRKQFPIHLCFAITINKSQGQSLAYVGIDLRSPCFSHEQFYVAGSQGQDSRTISVLLRPRQTGNDQDLVENVVYSEVLLPRIIV